MFETFTEYLQEVLIVLTPEFISVHTFNFLKQKFQMFRHIFLHSLRKTIDDLKWIMHKGHIFKLCKKFSRI